MNSFTWSSHRLFGLPLPLLPSTLDFLIIFIRYRSLHLFTCPNHLSLCSLITSIIDVVSHFFLMSSFRILSNRVIPLLLLHFFIFIVSHFWHSFSVNFHDSKKYISTALITVVYNLIFNLWDILLSFITLLTSFHFAQASLILSAIASSHPSFCFSIAPRHLKRYLI